MVEQQQQTDELPTAAQIPLQSFNVPDFPPHAHGLKALTLTCDIPLDEYTGALTSPFTVSDLPSQIESLTLELFSLGFPAGFLTQLAEKLPNLRELVLFQQLLGGVSRETQQDAVAFFERTGDKLRALHLLDVFAPPGALKDVGDVLRKKDQLRFLEVNYTTHHEEDFVDRIPGEDLLSLISPSLVTCAFNVAPSELEDLEDKVSNGDTDDAGKRKQEGIISLGKSQSSALMKFLTSESARPKHLKVLNISLYTLTVTQLRQLLAANQDLLVLNVAIDIDTQSSAEGDEEWTKLKGEILGALSPCKSLEQVELVGVPGLQFSIAMQNARRKAFERIWPDEEDMKRLADDCTRLALFQGNILRRQGAGSVEWRLEPAGWVGGVIQPLATATEREGFMASIVERS